MSRLTRIKRRLAGACSLAALVGLAVLGRPASAQSSCGVTVTSLADSGSGTLRNAIAAAAASGAARICFASGLQGTITLASPLSITSGVTIAGNGNAAGVGPITISGHNGVQDFVVDDTNADAVHINGLTIIDGAAQQGGAVLVSAGNVTLSYDQIQGNSAVMGGGIYNQGTLTISNTTLAANSSTDDSGGGIYNASGATLVSTGSVFNSNSTPGLSGGGLENQGTATITGGNFTGNTGSPGAAINNTSQLTVTGTYFYSNTSGQGGGAIENQFYGSVTVTGSTFFQNATSGAFGTATNGGAIDNAGGTVVVHESTFSGNTADGLGGALYNSGQLTLVQDTITANKATQGGSGVAQGPTEDSNPVALTNTIVSGNTTDDCSGCGTIPAGNLVGGTAMLGPLAVNVTPGPSATTANLTTFMPLPGSPAIAGGTYEINDVVLVTDPTDERGLSRLTINGNTVLVDIGAVQTHYSSVSFSAQPTSTQPNTTITPAVQVQVVEQDGSTTNYPQGVPVTLQLIPTVGMQPEGSLNGTLVESPTVSNSTGVVSAVFSDLSVTAAGSWELVATTYPTTQDGQIATYSATSNTFTTSTPVAMTQTALSISPNPPVYGTPETLTATVTVSGTGAPVQSGSVAFTNNGSSLGSITVTNGVATLTGVQVTLGANLLVASYTGNSSYGASGGGGTFNAKATPRVTLVTPPAILPGAALTTANLHATATGVNGVALPGTVTFSPAVGSVLAAGSQTVTATFTPTDTTDYSTGTASATVTVLAPSVSSTSLTVSPSSAYPGTAETLTTVAAPGNGILGVVGGSTSLGSQALALLPSFANFTSGSAISFSASGPLTAYSADLNGDGVVDQVVINNQSSQLELLLSDPASPGNFLAQKVLSTYGACYYVSSASIGDVNVDGLPDIVAACQNIGDGLNDGGPIVLFLNQGNGNFSAPVATGGQTGQAAGPMQGATVVLADLNGDGKLDLVSLGNACPVGGASCFAAQIGNGDGTFQVATYTQIHGGNSNDSFSNLQAQDFSGDGRSDLSFIYYPNGGAGVIQVWLSEQGFDGVFGFFGVVDGYDGSCTPGPCFSPSAAVNAGPSGNSPAFLVAADLNGDGEPDLAAVTTDNNTGSGNTVSIALAQMNQSTNTVTFPSATTDTVSAGAQSLAVADFNQDGKADLAVYSGTTNLISALIGDGTGAYPTTWQSTIGVTAPVLQDGPTLFPVFSVGDANGDGFPDILVAAPQSNSTVSAKIAITGGHSQATLATTAPSSTTTYFATTTPSSKYFSGSSGSALLTVTQDVVTLAWQPAAFTYGIDVPSTDLQATATINGQSATGTFVYTFTPGGAVINTATIYAAGTYAVQVAFTPTGSTNTYTLGTSLTINQATPTVTLVTPPELLPGAVLNTANLHAAATGLNGVVLVGTFSYSQALGSVPAAGSHTVTATFTPSDATDYTSGTASATFTVLAAQATATTLAATPNPALPGVSVALNATVAPASGLTGVVPGTVAFSAPTGTLATPRLALDQTHAAFQAGSAQTSTPQGDYNTYTADFNGDGVADLLIVPTSGPLQLALSQVGTTPGLATPISIANFGPACSNSSGTPTSEVGFAVGDANGDGLPDIAIACQNFDSTTTSLVLLVNQGAGTFTPSTITTLQNEYTAQLVFGDLNGDGKQDLLLLTNCNTDSSYPPTCLEFVPGNGDGTFGPATIENLSGVSFGDTFANLLAADFDHDGHLDIAFLHYSDSSSYGIVEVWKNNGGSSPTFGSVVNTGVYGPSATITAGNGRATLSSLISADLNVDGLPDLALVTTVVGGSGSDAYSSRSVALNTSSSGTLSFPAATTDLQTNGEQTAIVAADFDGDGVPDLALYNSVDNTVRVLHGAGDGTFAATAPNLVINVSAPVSLPGDIIGESRNSQSRRALAAGRSTRAGAQPKNSEINGLFYPVLAVGDVNGDGVADLLISQPALDQNYNITQSAQQFEVNGPSLAATSITAPVANTTYTATSAPSVPYWAGSTGTIALAITSLATQTSLAVTPASPTYGTALTLTSKVAITSLGTPATGGSVTFTEDGTVLSPAVNIDSTGTATYTLPSSTLPSFSTAGSHTFGASYSGSTGDAPSSASSVTVQVAKYTPALTWPTPAAITTTTPLSGTQLDAVAASLPGTTLALSGNYVYTPGAGTLLTAGGHTLSVTFTPTDTTDYTTAIATVQIQVNNTNTQTTLAIAPATSTYGQPLTLTAQVTNTTGSSPVQGGTVTFTSDNVTLSSVTVVNGVASLGSVVLTGGQHLIGASYTGESGEGTSAAASQTVTVGKATPTLTWPTPAPITTTTPLSGTQQDATAAGVASAALTGSFVYMPAAGATLQAGTQTLSVTFTPTDTTDYTTATASVQIQVASTTTRTSLTVSAEQSTYGTPLTLTAHVSNATGSSPVNTGTIAFSANSTTLSTVAVTNGVATLSGVTLPVGTPVLVATYTGASGEAGSSGTNTVTISKATPVLTWPAPAAISSTTPLSAGQLDATAAGAGTTGTLPGTFVYTPASGTLSVGTHTLSTNFTPTDTTDYTTATATVQIQVVNTNTRTTFSALPALPTYGQTLTLAAAVTNTSGSSVIQIGSVVFASDNVTLGTVSVVNGAALLAGVSLTGGQHLLTASYTGAGGEGASAAAAQTVTIAKAAPVLTWPAPAQITATTPLSATQLNATAAGLNSLALPGTFAYTPAAGTLLPIGAHSLSVTFTPTDTTDYATATSQATIQVIAETITLASISPTTTPIGTSPLPITLTGSGFPTGSVVQLNGTTLATTAISATQLGATIPAASLAKPSALALTIYDAASQALSNAVTLTVTAPTPTVTVTAPATVSSGDQPSVSVALASAYPVDLAGTLTLSFTPAGPDGVDDPAVQFQSGGRTLNFAIPAGATAGPTTAVVAGTVEGTIAIATQLTAGGVNVTPADLATPTDISVTPSAPTITGVAFTDINGLLTVVVTGYSNTREMTQAQFTFTGPGAGDLSTAGVILPATSLFGTWYGDTASAQFGSTFSYTQTFQLSDPTTNITGATVTLTNTVGTSASVNSQ